MHAGREELIEDYNALKDKYIDILEAHELCFALIQLSVKTLMDIAPRHGIAMETVKLATEAGINWHIEQNSKKEGLNGD